MEGDPEDLIRQFRLKVEEAINLLTQIPELHRKELWTYWQIISMAVKAAVGGRGPILAKQTASSRGRPRGRPRRHGQQSGFLSENGGKNQGDNKAIGSNSRKPGRTGKREKQNLSDRKSKVDLWSQGQQSDDFGETKRVHSNDKSSIASIGSTTMIDRQSSFVANNANHMISVLGSREGPFSSVINNSSTAGRISSSALVQEPASIVQTERSSSIAHNERLSQPDQTSVVELPQTCGISGDDPSEILKAQAMDSFQPTSEPHDKQGSSSGKRQENIVIQTSHDTAKQTSEKVKKSTDDIPHRPETLVVSFHEIAQNRSAMDETGSQIMITLPNEMEVSATSEPKNAQDSEIERLTSVTDSAVLQDKSGSVSETVEKLSKGNASAQTHGNFLAEVAQPLIPSATETSHSQTVETGIPQSCQGQCTKLAYGSTDIINADVTLSSSSLETKLDSLPCGSVATSVKRKRGRPRKYTADKQPQIFLAHSSSPSSIASHHSEKPPQISATDKNSEEKASRVDAFLPPPNKKQNNFTSIVTASDLKHKSKKTSHREPAVSTCATTVRRSERRTVPNRDERFCYFAPSHRGKLEEEDAEVKEEVEEEEEDDSVEETGEEETEEERVGAARVENREVKVKTEEEKRKERTCPKCRVVLKSASSLSAHMRIHTGERPFSCPVCHKSFTTKGNCERHEVTHVGLKAFSCPQCNKKFTEKKSLKIHMRAHTGERPYECQLCPMRFFQSGTLKTHMDRHTGHKGHLCDLCGKAFRQSCQLRVHMRRHKMHTPFQCQHCTSTFYTKSDMERHKLRHTGERPFSCDQCSKTFTRMQYLREHQNTHLGRRPYRCVVCGMTFHTFASCHRHVNKHKLPVATHSMDQQPAQQIHVEVTPDTPTHQVMEQVQVILDQQHLTDYHTSNVQTFIIPDHQSLSHTTGVATTSTITGPNPQSSAHAILSNLGLEVEESSEIYHVTLVEPGQGIAIPVDQRAASNSVSTVADFSAINLLANATTQLSAPP